MTEETGTGWRFHRRLGRLAKGLHLKDARRYLLNSLRFRTFVIGNEVRFLGRGVLAVAPNDNRGALLLKRAGVSQPNLTRIWRQLIKVLSPEIVLDIGANYGEFIMSSTYPKGARVYAFEPNPDIYPLLRRSLGSHRQADGIFAVNKAVSDREGRLRFTIDKKWSGTSSAIGKIEEDGHDFKGSGPEEFHEIEIEAVAVDRFLRQEGVSPTGNLVFKIDVEGFEGKVFRGMETLLKRARKFAGIFEFDCDYLARAGETPSELLAFTGQLGSVFQYTRNDGMVPIHDISQLREHNDLIICSDLTTISRLSRP